MDCKIKKLQASSLAQESKHIYYCNNNEDGGLIHCRWCKPTNSEDLKRFSSAQAVLYWAMSKTRPVKNIQQIPPK